MVPARSEIVRRIYSRTQRLGDQLARKFATRHVHGPSHIELGDSEVMVVALVKDSAYFMERFIKHHFELGARHMLIIDNGSTDKTVEIAKRFDNLTIVRNTLPAKAHESQLRSEIARTVGRGGWVLFADADELVELPVKGAGALARITRYCNDHGYTAVVGHMLDRFSIEHYENLRHLAYDDAITALNLFSLHMVESLDYHDITEIGFHYFLARNVCENPRIQFKQGGVRREIFGENPFLSKHSLVRNVPGVDLMTHPHCASRVRIADLTLLLHHYKLAGDWAARDARSVHNQAWDHGQDRQRLSALSGGSDWRLGPAHPREWAGVEDLLRDGFLFASPRFLAASNRP